MFTSCNFQDIHDVRWFWYRVAIFAHGAEVKFDGLLYPALRLFEREPECYTAGRSGMYAPHPFGDFS